MPSWLMMLFTELPALIQAIQAILKSDPAKTIEQAISELINHVTPGKPNSPALGPRP